LAYFKDDQEVYGTIGKLFRELAADEELAPRFRTADTIVQYDYTEPDAVITVRLHEGQPSEVDFGQTDMDPEVAMSMKADVAHRFQLAPLTKPIFPRNKAMLQQQGRDDLIDV
jgi:hypothetical protein